MGNINGNTQGVTIINHKRVKTLENMCESFFDISESQSIEEDSGRVIIENMRSTSKNCLLLGCNEQKIEGRSYCGYHKCRNPNCAFMKNDYDYYCHRHMTTTRSNIDVF